MKKKRKGWARIIAILLVAVLLGGGAYYLYQRGGSGEEGSAYVQSVAEITGMGHVGLYAQDNGKGNNTFHGNEGGDILYASNSTSGNKLYGDEDDDTGPSGRFEMHVGE